MSKSYLVASAAVEEETIVNRSRFICYLSPCTSTEEARALVKIQQANHPQASHHCYAYLSAAPDDSQHYGFSDDGEPSGTAGKPMLSMLQGGNVGEVCAVVVRYFGGTKLGTGGLQRAYGASVRNALAKLPTTIKIPMVDKRLACQYTQVNDVQHLLELFGGSIKSQDYGQQVVFILSLPLEQVDNFAAQLQTMSAGQLSLTKV
ncbi:YigZ family protein [Thalassotalea agariperforans]